MLGKRYKSLLVIFKRVGLYNMVSLKSETILSELSSKKNTTRFKPTSPVEKEIIHYLLKL